jgi:hypothetical protein
MRTTESSPGNEGGARERDRALERTLRDALALTVARRWLTRRFGRLATRRTRLSGATFAVSPATWPGTARC